MKNLSVILLVSLLISCSKNKNDAIYGNWYFEKEIVNNKEKTSLSHFNLKSFNIKDDSLIDFKRPFIYTIETKTRSVNEENTQYSYSGYLLGSVTNYHFSNNNLIYLNKNSNKWDTIFIKKINSDNLEIQLEKNGNTFLYKKNESIYNNSSNYDAIIVDRGPCFGDCPINSTYINRNGDYFFKATDYNTVFEGNYKATLDKFKTKQIFNYFDRIDFKNLKDNYSYPATDSQTNYVTFLKNGKIVKTIQSYIDCPIDLEKAFTELSYLYQKTDIKHNQDFLLKGKQIGCSFNNSIQLKDSEMYYLEILLLKGKKINFNFKKTYKLDYFTWGDENLKNIYTDGRYYQINYKDNTTKTIDIGYNFIENNPIIKQKRIE